MIISTGYIHSAAKKASQPFSPSTAEYKLNNGHSGQIVSTSD